MLRAPLKKAPPKEGRRRRRRPETGRPDRCRATATSDSPNPRPDLKRGMEAEEQAVRRAARPSHTEMNTRSKRRLEAL